jgi:hypothetical protein
VPEAKTRFGYQYDFGDDWQHAILVEKILPAEPDLYYPLCLAGKRSGLPEDCGGSWGYAELLKILKILKSPHHPDHQEMKQSAGERFEPETVDLEEINQRLRRLRV